MKYRCCKGKLLSVLLNSKEQFQTFIFQIEKDRVSKQCETLQPSPATIPLGKLGEENNSAQSYNGNIRME